MNENITVGDCVSPLTHKYIAKIYKIRIVSFQKGGIWYTRKVGQEYYAILAVKENGSPVFRLIEVNEARTYLTATALILDVYPSDCNITDEFIVRSNRTLKHIFM